MSKNHTPTCGTCLCPTIVEHYPDGKLKSVYCERCEKYLYEEEVFYKKEESDEQ